MNKLLFKTSLKCNGCVNAISTGMNQIPEIKHWSVDLTSDDRILEVEASSDISEAVIAGVKKAGYEINRLE